MLFLMHRIVQSFETITSSLARNEDIAQFNISEEEISVMSERVSLTSCCSGPKSLYLIVPFIIVCPK